MKSICGIKETNTIRTDCLLFDRYFESAEFHPEKPKLLTDKCFRSFFSRFFVLFLFRLFVLEKGETVQLNYVSSQKGKFQLAHGGFYYVREKVVNNKVYWRCIEYTSKLRCHARIHTVGESIVRSTPHSHEPVKAKKKVYWIGDSIGTLWHT